MFSILTSLEKFQKLRFRDGLVWTAGLTVGIKLCFRDGLVWTAGLTVGIKLCFSNFSGVLCTGYSQRQPTKENSTLISNHKKIKVDFYIHFDEKISLFIQYEYQVKSYKHLL